LGGENISQRLAYEFKDRCEAKAKDCPTLLITASSELRSTVPFSRLVSSNSRAFSSYTQAG
jgi:hypothetical protein